LQSTVAPLLWGLASAMRKWPYKRGALSREGQFIGSSILLSQSIWPDKRGDFIRRLLYNEPTIWHKQLFCYKSKCWLSHLGQRSMWDIVITLCLLSSVYFMNWLHFWLPLSKYWLALTMVPRARPIELYSTSLDGR
jgi:hypothetical protein